MSLLACDWGTTNLRAWVLDRQGQVLRHAHFSDLGVGSLAAGAAEDRFEAQVRPRLEAAGMPAILCGMVGSNLGWAPAPYAPCPADLQDLAERCARPNPDVRIAPGVRWDGFDGQGDVMRGEETQIAGWLALHPAAATGRRLACLPGTHTKWVEIVDGRITRFVTAMTGELFAVLRAHSVLRTPGPDDDMAAFDRGVAAAGATGGGLAARLFTARARVVGGDAPAESTTSYLSGLLIAADIAGSPALIDADVQAGVDLIGAPKLCSLYARALGARGSATRTHDGERAVIAGLLSLAQTEAHR